MLTHDPRHEQVRGRHLAAIEQGLSSLRAGTAAARVEPMAREIHRYLAARAAEEATGDGLSDVVGDLRGPLDAALGTLDSFVAEELARAEATRAQAARWDRLGDVAGLMGAALLLLGMGAALVWARRSVYLPLRDTQRAIAELAAGARSARAPERGPAEIAGSARTVNEMADSLEREREGRAAFLAAVAHELRTPLSALKMATTTLGRQSDPRAEQRERLLTLMARQIQRLDRMLGDLLFAARAEAGQMELSFELCDARSLVRDCLALYQSYSDQHSLQLELADEPDPAPAGHRRRRAGGQQPPGATRMS